MKGILDMYIKDPNKLSLPWQMLIGCIFSLITGTLLHFVYEWSGKSQIVALFSPINESPWEHLKLVYYPILVFLIIQLIYMANTKCSPPNLILFTVLSALLAMIIVTVLYYTYRGILGKDVMWLDIATFVIAIIAAYIFNYNMLKIKTKPIPFSNIMGMGLFLILFAIFAYCTLYPPKLDWFKSPEK